MPLYIKEKDYISGKHKYITSGTNITKLINLIGKTLPEIRREILYAEQNGTLVDEMAESMYKECPSMSLDEGIQRYFNSWVTHDSFALSVANHMDMIVSNPKQRVEVAQNFMANDRLIRVYVSKNLPFILDSLKNKIALKTGKEIIPAIDSFEFFLIEEAGKAYKDNNELKRFADTYAYGDVSFAEEEVKRLFKPSSQLIYDKIIEKKQGTKANFEKSIEDLLQKSDADTLKDVHRYLRLSHWAGFEEPRKRYIIEAGITDYLFRELVFQKLKKDGFSHPLIDGKKFCLEIDQKSFFCLLGELHV